MSERRAGGNPHLVAEAEEVVRAVRLPSLRLPLPGDVREVEEDVHECGVRSPRAGGGDERPLVGVAVRGRRRTELSGHPV